MRHRRPAALAAAFVLLAAVPSFSQVGLYLGPYAGVSAQKPSFENVRFDRNTTFLYGLRAGVQVLMLALEFHYFKAGHAVEMEDFLLFNWDGLENDYSFFGGGLRLMFPLPVVRPFLALGHGSYTAELRGVDLDRRRGWNFGGGLEVKLGRLALIGEGKWQRATFVLDDFEIGLGDFTFTAGLNIYW
ncbi:MAG: hypothetical protein FJY82_06520 [Candidatus Aminicenantes bacterium]|nr:hypothetical protein [Candidatus Aminicenantes bacterium]